MEKQEIQETRNSPIYSPWLLNSEKAISSITSKTTEEAVLSHSPAVGLIYMLDKGAAIKTLTYLIADVVEYLNLGNTMNAPQTLQTVQLILEDREMKNLKPDDFKICFDNVKKGYYGKAYNRIDGMVIFEWLHQYLSERLDVAENLNLKTHSEKLAEKIKPEEVNPEGQKKVVEILKSVIESTKVAKIEKTKPQKSPRDEFIQKCFRDHRDAWDNAPAYDTKTGQDLPGRYILLNGKPVDEIEYTHEKLKEYDLNNIKK